MVKALALATTIFLSACASFYVEPPSQGNEAVLSIEVDEPFEFNAPFGMLIEAEIDGKLFHSYNYPDLKARLTPGTHKLAVSLNAYYSNRAKHHFTKVYEIDFKPNSTYVISSKVSAKTLQKLEDNVTASYSIKGAGVDITVNIVLEDSAMRSMVCQVPDCKPPIIIFQ
jgi:hypothetical protein